MNRYPHLCLKNFHLEIFELEFQLEFLVGLAFELEEDYLEEWAAAPRRQPGPDSRHSSSRVPDRLLETGATSVATPNGAVAFSPCQSRLLDLPSR